mmetsp:Transcript_2678/g.4509  ORF Transcript_2678/g.4509 Transcript_2678/m.4509 type:complete len:153 (+) Transcript_2678:1409-1867(+)
MLSFTAPLSGVIIGGIVITNLGGYNSKRSHYCLVCMGLGAVLVCLPAPFIDKVPLFGSLIWLLLFFGGFILPPLTGIMLNSVSENQKTSANSLANLAYNLFGYMPSPLFYGFVSTLAGGEESRWAMGCLLYSTLITMVLLVPALRTLINEKS